MKTLDLSKNSLSSLDARVATLINLKNLNLEQNKFPAGSLVPIAKLTKLQSLSVGGNLLGKPIVTQETRVTKEAFPDPLPKGLKQLKVNHNFLSNVPRPIVSSSLTKLEKLDLSFNQLAAIPAELCNLVGLTDLNLNNNVIVGLPDNMGNLKKLKVLSLKSNHISVSSTKWSETNPQPLPKALFVETPLIDLNLHGNPMTSTQLNEMEGIESFLERRQKVKTTTLLGGGLTNLDVCGLE